MSHGFSDFGQDFNRPPPSKSAKTPIALAIVGGIGLIALLICCGAGVWIVNFGMSVVSADIENQLRDHPAIRQHVGAIQSLEVNWPKSLAEADYDIWTYDIQGTKTSGELIVESRTDDDGNEVIIAARLRLSTGEEIELSID